MARKSRENPEIRAFVLDQIAAHPRDIVPMTARQFGITRNTANRYVRKLVSEGLLNSSGETKARKYDIRDFLDYTHEFLSNSNIKEDVVWREYLLPLMGGVRPSVLDITQYGVTEMVNNVIDHSESDKYIIQCRRNIKDMTIIINDSGIGIFNKIQRRCGLDDPRHALLELSKGKLTTDPQNHTGEGIFFTSRMFHEFTIYSGNLYYRRTMEEDDDWLIEVEKLEQYVQGTDIRLRINMNAPYTSAEVFKKYEDDDFGFARTHVPIRLAKYDNEQLLSRSQARRVLARFEKFSEVILDFKEVPRIGQAFADEIFRVYKGEHPEIQIYAVRAAPEVQQMIDHAMATARMEGNGTKPRSSGR